MYAEPGYLPHSKPAMYTLALQNGRSPTCLLRLPTLLCSPARARQPSVRRASGCVPPSPAVLPEERRERTNPLLWPQFLKRRSHRPRAQSKTIEVNLQVSIAVWFFFSPFLLCKLSLLVLFSTGLANVLLLQLKLCPVTELHTGFA